MTSLSEALELAAQDSYLAVVATTRSDGSVQASVVNAGAVEHPVTGQQSLGFVTYGPGEAGTSASAATGDGDLSGWLAMGDGRRLGAADRPR